MNLKELALADAEPTGAKGSTVHSLLQLLGRRGCQAYPLLRFHFVLNVQKLRFLLSPVVHAPLAMLVPVLVQTYGFYEHPT